MATTRDSAPSFLINPSSPDGRAARKRPADEDLSNIRKRARIELSAANEGVKAVRKQLAQVRDVAAGLAAGLVEETTDGREATLEKLAADKATLEGHLREATTRARKAEKKLTDHRELLFDQLEIGASMIVKATTALRELAPSLVVRCPLCAIRLPQARPAFFDLVSETTKILSCGHALCYVCADQSRIMNVLTCPVCLSIEPGTPAEN